ncbi:twin-arginine translocase subunit TatC [Streptomyces sp. DSM 42041]|uniref:Sec-independent protein translocase protein TatC n=2 Tax=Streptomyces hazeniae TaxID=3075538 RepID=A0ABU2NQD7_9ACTN|nr:twin-arginine translocase subunit TatC [Streptomyces sp. DSM 42041]MDT0379199.1 twin-arginine translocase subunit TatC [Streptomyces sp. DSM 42041]
MLKSARKQGNQPKDPEGRMPLVEHLRELRNRLMKAVLAILAVTVLGMVFYEQVADFLTEPMLDRIGCEEGFGASATREACANLTINGLVGPFTVMLKIALTVGVVLASPIWLYQFWGFLAPGLHRHEKKYAGAFVCTGVPLFLAGAYIAYLILPTAAEALIGFTPQGTNNLIDLGDFVDIIARLVLVFGLAFELPLVLVMMNMGGLVTGRQMLGWWRIMVVCITVFSAVATPTGDPLTMGALAAPIVLLYFGAVGVALLNDRRRERNDPYRGLDDDEASELEHAPEPVAAAAPLGDDTPEAGDDRRPDGYGDAT